MNYAELVEDIASRCGMPAAHVRKVLDELPEAIAEALIDGESLRWIGFGSFRVTHRAARTGRNPRNGAPVPIPARRTVQFKLSKKLKERVNG